MFSLVLLALADKADGARAARLASSVAARHGAGFAAMHVSGPLGAEGSCVLRLPAEAELEKRRTEVEEMLRATMPAGLTADVMHAAGFVHLEVLKSARVLGPDLLVLGGVDAGERCRRELSGARSSAAALLAEAAPCPVLMVADEARVPAGPFEHVLVLLDLAREERRLRAVLSFAARLAAREGAALSALHVLPLPAGAPAPDQEEMAQRVEESLARMGYLCKGLPGADRISLRACEGSSAVEALKLARERKADALVLEHSQPELEHILAGVRLPVFLLGPGGTSRMEGL